MCSICGILGGEREGALAKLRKMSSTMSHRGPDQSGTYVKANVALAHNRLAIIDPENGVQPMTRSYYGRKYTIVYNGELYNTQELTALIRERGIQLGTYCDTEVVLYSYILFGKECAGMLNGIFAFAVYDEAAGEVYFARDRFGIKPLFYAQVGGAFIFASEIKAILNYEGVRARLSQKGLWELLFLAPDRFNGGVFEGIDELPPASCAVWRAGVAVETFSYWQLEARECKESRDEIIEHTRELLLDAIQRQLVSDVPLCTLLSGGLDSSIISSVASRTYERRGERLSTYSFEYEHNRESFKSSLFQPQSDDSYARYMAEWLHSDHKVLTADTASVAELLGEAALYRDFPGQADIDSSLLYFCSEIKHRHTVAISGECADEIFGGYPWFYRPEMLKKPFFPWIHDPMLRPRLFDDSFARAGEGYRYMQQKYQKSMSGCPVLDTDSESMLTSRRATWLSVNFFMTSLLERKDRMSMASSVEVRVPFADHRILEYIYNVPWEIKFENQTEKALLRNAMADFLPDKILHRKKSPYPKTQDPQYERLVRETLQARLNRKDSLLAQMLDRRALEAFLGSGEGTWFGQLMGRAQLLAWLLQFDIWAQLHNLEFVG